MARKRRGRGEGSVFIRKDGIWCGSITTGYNGQGKRLRRYVYAGSKADVLEKLTRLQGDVLNGTLGEPSRLTMRGFLQRWLEDAARPAVRPATYRLYAGVIRLHTGPRLGGILLSRLTPVHVQGLLTSLEKDGASPRLRQIVYGVMHRALGQALKWGMVPRNVCDAIVKPRAPRPTMRVLTEEQVARLLGAAKDDRLYALYVLSVTTGMRQGEMLGLHWDDVDLRGAAVHVRHQLQENNGHPILAEPKTARARRRVDLPEIAVQSLRDHRARMLAEGHPHNLVFCDTGGQPLRKSNLVRRSFQPLLRRAELPSIRFHDLRHTAATLLLSQGVHPKVVQERLGHAQVSITLDTYSHVLPSMGKEAAAKLDSLFASLAP